MLPLDARVGDVREDEVRQRVGEDGCPVSGDVDLAEDEIDEWSGEEDEARQTRREVRHRVEVAEALRRPETARKQRVVGAHDLDHAASPADALLDVAAQALCCQTGRLRDVDVGGVPAVHLHTQ